MQAFTLWLVSCCVLATAITTSAEQQPLDCSKKSLAEAVQDVTANHLLVTFTGVCEGPIVVTIDGLTLQGVGTAVIDGGGEDAVTITGASRVSLIDLEVTNGRNGVIANHGAYITLSGVNAHHNTQTGIAFQTGAGGVLSDVSATNNGRGLIADNALTVLVTDSTITGNSTSDVQLTFGTRADLRTLTFGTYSCDATVLVRGISGIMCPH
jgi:hypothetical protein